MARYTVQSPSGKKVTFEWGGSAPPTDADMDEIFGEVDAPSSVDATLAAPNFGPTVGMERGAKDTTPPSDLAMDPPPSPLGLAARIPAEIAIGGLKGAGQMGVNLWNAIDKMGPESAQSQLEMPPSLAPEGWVQGAGALGARGGTSLAAGVLAPQSIPAQMAAGGVMGAAQTGTPEGAAGGALLSGALTGGGQLAAAGLRQGARGLTAIAENPALARLTRGGVGLVSPRLRNAMEMGGGAMDLLKALSGETPKKPTLDATKAAVEEAKAFLAARKSAEMAAEELGAGTASGIDDIDAIIAARYPAGVEAPTRAASSGTTPSLSMDPPPSFKPSASTSSTGITIVPKGQSKLPTTGGGKRADLPPTPMEKTGNIVHPAGKIDLNTAMKELQAATTPQARGALIKKWMGEGHSAAERGRALSHATNVELDPEDIQEAANLVRELGGAKFARQAVERMKSTGELTAEEARGYLNAINRAGRQKGGG